MSIFRAFNCLFFILPLISRYVLVTRAIDGHCFLSGAERWPLQLRLLYCRCLIVYIIRLIYFGRFLLLFLNHPFNFLFILVGFDKADLLFGVVENRVVCLQKLISKNPRRWWPIRSILIKCEIIIGRIYEKTVESFHIFCCVRLCTIIGI